MIQKYKSILYLVLLSIVASGALGYYMYHKPVAGLEHVDADYNLSPEELLLEFQSDEETANAKYLNKVIELTGIISSIKEKNITLAIEGEFAQVICEMRAPESFQNISKGQKITIKGQCSGFLMDVVLVNCNITSKS